MRRVPRQRLSLVCQWESDARADRTTAAAAATAAPSTTPAVTLVTSRPLTGIKCLLIPYVPCAPLAAPIVRPSSATSRAHADRGCPWRGLGIPPHIFGSALSSPWLASCSRSAAERPKYLGEKKEKP